MKNSVTMELREDLDYCQRKIKLAMAQLEVIENDEQFNQWDITTLLLELESTFKCRMLKMQELEMEMSKERMSKE